MKTRGYRMAYALWNDQRYAMLIRSGHRASLIMAEIRMFVIRLIIKYKRWIENE